MADEKTPNHKVPWLSVILGILALIAFWNISGQMGRGVVYDVMSVGGMVPPMATEPSMPMREADYAEVQSGSGSAVAYPASVQMDMAEYSKGGGTMGMPMPTPYYPGYGGTANANDTREFNKMYYSASMQTRDVPKLTRRVETTVRGHGGRIDNISSGDKYGSISFVIPQSKYDSFRDELEGLVNSRFLQISINSQNMLGQKQAIEKQQDYTNMNLDELSATRKKQISEYNAKRQEILYQIDANDREKEMLDKSYATADQNARMSIANRQMELMAEQGNLRNQLKTLENSHLATINSIDAQVRYLDSNKKELEKQDTALMDDVATVNGSVSIQWISLWQMAQLYLPGYSIPGILAVLAVLALWWQRRKESVL